MVEQSRQMTFRAIGEKVEANARLSAAEGEFLFEETVDLHAVGRLADRVRRRKHTNFAYYHRNVHLNPTNVCRFRCELCAYSCDPTDAKAYVMNPNEILERGREAVEAGCTELHLVGGLHPEKKFDWYVQILRDLHEQFPRLHLKAYGAMEIAWFSQITQREVGDVLRELIEAGLGSLPGGGAEIFDPRVRGQIASKKADADTWLDVHRTAHLLGLRSNATMLYGHIEKAADRVDHLLRLRKLQDETGGFQAFVPLAFHPKGTRLAHIEKPTALDDLRTMAISRLLLDNFEHIKAYWISLGVGTAQTALAYGADDLDGTVFHERIHHDAGSQSPEVLSVDHLRALITEAGCNPLERSAIYRPVRRNGAQWQAD